MNLPAPVEQELDILAPRLDDEPQSDYELFAYYVSLPPTARSASAVARQFGVSVRRVQEVAIRNNWVERARAHDLSLLALYRSDAAQKIVQSLTDLAEVVSAVSARLVECIQDMELTPALAERMLRSLADVASVLAQFPLPYDGEKHDFAPERMTNVLAVLFNTGTSDAGIYREPITITATDTTGTSASLASE